MEWANYILTVVISAGIGTIFGALATHLLESRKHKQELEQARVNRILQPLRGVESRLLNLKAMYEMYNYPQFCSDLEQVSRIIKNDILEGGLGWDIVKESKSLMENLLKLIVRYLEAKAIHQWRESQIKQDDIDSINRLLNAYQIQLFNDEQIKNLVRQLTDELGNWLREHS